MSGNDEEVGHDFSFPAHYAKLDDPTPLHCDNELPATDSDSLLKRRRVIEPWLCSLLQAEHLALLVGSGLPIALCNAANVQEVSMKSPAFQSQLRKEIEAEARRSVEATGRGSEPNIEDRLRAAIAVYEGLRIVDDSRAPDLRAEIDQLIHGLLTRVLKSEEDFLSKVRSGEDGSASDLLKSFLLTFSSRAGTRDRLQLFTTNYDRYLEFGCDLAGIRIIDRFVGAIEPVFRASRLNIDMHYNPPGIRGEPRYLEGVIRLTKLHGSLDWRSAGSKIWRCMLPFGASEGHPEIPRMPYDSVVVYPNAAKDVETISYPYAELFRDFAAAVCRPNAVLVTFGYGFGDDHINRVILDALTIPSTHVVIISFDDPGKRVSRFCRRVGSYAQLTILLGPHFGDLKTLVDYYLPKPALDSARARMTTLLQRRGETPVMSAMSSDPQQATDDGGGSA